MSGGSKTSWGFLHNTMADGWAEMCVWFLILMLLGQNLEKRTSLILCSLVTKNPWHFQRLLPGSKLFGLSNRLSLSETQFSDWQWWKKGPWAAAGLSPPTCWKSGRPGRGLFLQVYKESELGSGSASPLWVCVHSRTADCLMYLTKVPVSMFMKI